MQFITKYLRKIVVAAIGIPVLILGIILIPAPGPGLLVCFLGLFILSLEFDGAKKYKDKVQGEFQKIVNNAKDKQAEAKRKLEADQASSPKKLDKK